MKIAHTPAPWKVVSGSVYSNDDIPIAHMERDANKARGIPPVERDRNAHLIAAAPELLEALQLLLNAFIHTEGNAKGNKAKTDIITLNPGVRDALNASQTAIAKAIERI